MLQLEATSREKCVSVEQELQRVESEAASVRAELLDAKRLTEELTAELRERRRELRQWDTDKSKLLVANQRIKVLYTCDLLS